MLVNRLRGVSPFFHAKVDAAKIELSEKDKTIVSARPDLSTEIACAILGAGIANQELSTNKMMPWDDDPVAHISPFFIYADHREPMRLRTKAVVARAKSARLDVESVELNAHTWPYGPAYDMASAFADRILRLDYQ